MSRGNPKWTYKHFIVMYILNSLLGWCESLEYGIFQKFSNFGCLKGTIEVAGENLVFMEKTKNDLGHSFLLNSLEDGFESFTEVDSVLITKSKTIMRDSQHKFQKSPSMLINELAQLNNIHILYRLVAEHGPPHQKIFMIELELGDEKYTGISTTLKNAKNIASVKALKETKYEHPTLTSAENQLYELAKKRNERVLFVNEYEQIAAEEIKSPIFFLNNKVQNQENISTINLNQSENYKSQNIEYDPVFVRLEIGNREYKGMGYSIKEARHEASVKALEEIKAIEMEEYCAVGNDCVPTSESVNQWSSPISLIYETSSKIDKRVVFSTVDEKGPAHSKVFTIRCQVDELVTEGSGKSKKIAKKIAAELMLEKFKKLDWIETAINKKKRKLQKKKKSNVINKENVVITEDVPQVIYDLEPTLIEGKEEKKIKLKLTKNKKSMKDTFIDLAKKLGISFQYWDIPKRNHEKYLSFLSINFESPEVCFGVDSVLETAREKASLNAVESFESYAIGNTNTRYTKNKKDQAHFQSFFVENEETAFIDKVKTM